MDVAPYEKDVLAGGLKPEDWGALTAPADLTINWHVPKKEELAFAFDLFQAHASAGIKSVKSLLDGSAGLKTDNKAWSDDLTRDLNLLRLLISGVASLFDNDEVAEDAETNGYVNGHPNATNGDTNADVVMADAEAETEEHDDFLFEVAEIEEKRPRFTYPSGYALEKGEDIYKEIHETRKRIGEVLHQVYGFLVSEKEDDVPCLTTLCSAYKFWISDVGIEKTAHTLDRVTRLYAADIQPYKIAGLRKHYPRAILLRRAYVYHLQRQRYNAQPRLPSQLEEVLVHDLARLSVSTYTEVRRHAQNAIESASKSLIGIRTLLFPEVLQAFEDGIKDEDNERIKGAMHMLILGTLSKLISRDWRYTPRLIKAYLAACNIDDVTIQKICSSATFPIMDFSRQKNYEVLYNKYVLSNLGVSEPDEEEKAEIQRRIKILSKRREKTLRRKQDLADELADMTRAAHWKTASRIAAILISLGLRFKSLVSNELAALLARGTVDVHPGLRSLYSGAFVALLSLIQTRAACEHDYHKYILGDDVMPGRITVSTKSDVPGYTQSFLQGFAKPSSDHYLDNKHVGWLVWTDEYSAVEIDIKTPLDYDDVERKVTTEIGSCLDREWFSSCFKYLLQEPRDQAADRFRGSNTVMLAHAFDYVAQGKAAITLEDLKEEIELAYGDGSTKHQHRTLAEIFSGLIGTVYSESRELRDSLWSYIMPKLLKIFREELTPENSGYWLSFIHVIFRLKDPRRSWPMLDWLASFRLDMSSNAAFKESSKIQLLQECLSEAGWQFRLEQPIKDDFLQHIDHPYKAVREAIGSTLATIYRTRYHKSYKNVREFLEHQKGSGPLGSRAWAPSDDFSDSLRDVFRRIEVWRQEREPGQQTPSSYTNGSKTALIWLDSMLSSQECILLQPFFPDLLLEPLLHMMDVKEDQELQVLAYHVFRQIPNVPQRTGEDAELLEAMIRTGRNSPFWHQRLRVLVNVQVFYFRRLFLMTDGQQRALFECVSEMLADAQLEVRMGAQTTLSGMIRCSRARLRDKVTADLIKDFTRMLLKNPLPKRAANGHHAAKRSSGLNTPTTGTSTPTPEHTKLVLTRHAAVLGLGALVQAHPYTSPPPAWVPGVLTTLANKANSDPGVVGKSVKTILADFKKTRQDTWQMDLKAFSPEQVEDLEGVLWKSYFA